jgi:hypothetical protein
VEFVYAVCVEGWGFEGVVYYGIALSGLEKGFEKGVKSFFSGWVLDIRMRCWLLDIALRVAR